MKELKANKKPPVEQPPRRHGPRRRLRLLRIHDQNEGKPVCVEFKTGEIKWGPEKSPTGCGGSASVLYADGRLYFRYIRNGMMEALIEPSPEELKVISTFNAPNARREILPPELAAPGHRQR